MNFLAPSLLLGLLAAGLPWLVHLIGKRKARTVPFAAMELLLRADRRISARRRLREVLLLLARTAIAAALPLVFARPFTLRPSDLPSAHLGSQSAVLLLDDSASMQRRRGGSTLFERAQEQARNVVRQLPGDAELALVLASVGSEPTVGELTGERGRILERLEMVQASHRAADFAQSLRRAALILTAAQKAERRIFVFTDLQAAGWPEETPLTEPGSPDVVLVDVSEGAAWSNRAVVSVTAEPASDLGPGGMAVEAEVADFSGDGTKAGAGAQINLTLKVDGVPVTQATVDLPSNGRVRKRFIHTAGTSAGIHDIEVALQPSDDFPADDRRFTRLALARSLRALIINGDARTTAREDESFFIERALKAGDRTTSVTVTLPDDVSADRLAQFNVVYVLNVGRPSAELGAALSRFVESGGGVFLSVGRRVDPESWNRTLSKILPQPLSAFSRTAAALPGAVGGETMDNRPAERLGPLDRRHPLLALFPQDGQGLTTARFYKYLLLEPVPDTLGAQVILRFANGAPALTERAIGKGRVMFLSTTIDREWTDLPIQPGFLPLMAEAARRLSGTAEGGGPMAIEVGTARELSLGGDDQRVEITKPDGSSWVMAREKNSSNPKATFKETDLPGPYSLRVASGGGGLTPRPEEGFVVNLSRHESEPARLSPERRPDRVKRAASGGAAPNARVELWHGLAAFLVAIVLLESLLTLKWRRSSPALQRDS